MSDQVLTIQIDKRQKIIQVVIDGWRANGNVEHQQ